MTGTASLAGNFVLDTDPGIYRKGTQYDVLTAGSITSSNFTSITATNGLDVGLTNTPTTLTATLLNGNFSLVDATPNQTAIAGGVVNYPVGVSDFDPVANALVALPAGAVQNAALDTLGGEIDADMLVIGRDAMRGVFDNLSDQISDSSLAGPRSASGRTIWFKGYGGFGTAANDGNAHGFSNSGGGGMIGVQDDWGPDTSVGGAVSYTHTDISLHDLSQNGAFNTVAVSVYGEQRWGNVFADGAAAMAYDHGDTTRNIVFPGVDRQATGVSTALREASGQVSVSGSWVPTTKCSSRASASPTTTSTRAASRKVEQLVPI